METKPVSMYNPSIDIGKEIALNCCQQAIVLILANKEWLKEKGICLNPAEVLKLMAHLPKEVEVMTKVIMKQQGL